MTSTIDQQIKEQMIGLEQLTELLETVLFTGHLINCIPISCMLIAPSGAGKSKLVMQYKESLGCHVTTDITSMGMQTLLADDKEEKIKFVIVPDFNIVLSHRAATLQLTIGNLLSMTSEGTIRIDDGRGIKEVKHGPIGVMSAMTRDMYGAIGKRWIALGFSRRFLPINYDYGVHTTMLIQRSIARGETTALQLEDNVFQGKITPSVVEMSNEISNAILEFSGSLAENIGWIPGKNRDGTVKAVYVGKQMEFSPHLVLRTLARAHALRAGRFETNMADVDFCMKVIEFTRFDRPVIL